MRKIILIAAVFTLAACATPRERIADGLTGYGLDQQRAEGLAPRGIAEGAVGDLDRAGLAGAEDVFPALVDGEVGEGIAARRQDAQHADAQWARARIPQGDRLGLTDLVEGERSRRQGQTAGRRSTAPRLWLRPSPRAVVAAGARMSSAAGATHTTISATSSCKPPRQPHRSTAQAVTG